MEKLKIKVGCAKERSEDTELLIDLGYKKAVGFDGHEVESIQAWDDGELTQHNHHAGVSPDFKEITLPELRDLVVLKRNDVRDAQYTDKYGSNIYIDSSANVYYFEHRQFNNGQHLTWVVSGINYHRPESLKDDYISELKPIEKNMSILDTGRYVEKEYINKNTGEYLKTADSVDGDQWVEIPSDAEFSTISNGSVLVWKHDASIAVSSGWTDWNYNHAGDFPSYLDCFPSAKIIWQRHSHPEDLPFIDNNSRSASDIADAAMAHIRERAATYDQEDGERSAAKTAAAFNAITGKNLTEADIWQILCILKMVRQCSREAYHVDSAEDLIAYSALWAESLERDNDG